MKKACDCDSTSSGPRVISTTRGNGCITKYVNMACDACGTEWVSDFDKYVWPLNSPKIQEGTRIIGQHLLVCLAIEGNTLRLRSAMLIDPLTKKKQGLKLEIVEPRKS